MADRRKLRRVQRLRSRALWAFLVAGIVLGATLVGVVQYLASGHVSVRPGYSPVDGSDALALLVALSCVGLVFTICGFVLRARANRHDGS